MNIGTKEPSGFILLGEDYEDDVVLFRRFLERANLNYVLLNLSKANDFATYLSGTGEYADRLRYPMPDLIFLDGQLHHYPSMGLLGWIIQNPVTCQIPVVVLTGSLDPLIATQAIAAGAIACFQKPFTMANWAELAQALQTRGRSPKQ